MPNFPASFSGTKHVEVFAEYSTDTQICSLSGDVKTAWVSQGFALGGLGLNGHVQIDVKVDGASIGKINSKLVDFVRVHAAVGGSDAITDNEDGTYDVSVITGKTISYDIQISGNWDLINHTFGSFRGAGNYSMDSLDYGAIDLAPSCE